MDARFGRDGRPSFVQDAKRGITINRASNGVRQVVSVKPDGARVVSYGMNRGYVERQVRPGYVQRTYVMGGRQNVRVYRTYSYNGVVYQRYVPAVYYQPAFYAWAGNPWSSPISFSWGWDAQPWYGYYLGYFRPSPVYSDAALWLTDFLLAENLRMDYDQQQGAQAPPQSVGQSAPISPAVKLALANEVRRQLAASSQEAATQSTAPPASASANPPVAPPPALDPDQRVFVIGSNLDAPTAGGATCALGPGDIVIRTDDRIGAGNTIGVTVLSSKAGDCPGNSTASIDVTVLQEAHNQFSAQLDSGLSVLASNQGTGGIPSGPRAGAFNSRDGQSRADLNAEASLIQQQQQSANQAELEVQIASTVGGQ
jgi:hypothetical protein